MTEHEIRWKQDGLNDAYDPLHRDGPWTVTCTCGGAEKHVRFKVMGKVWHEFHKESHGY